MPDLHKKVLLALAVGVVLGWILTAFVFYPPAPGWAMKEHWGDVATWTAASAAGVAAAATFYAARVALKASRDATANERALRDIERADASAEMVRRQKALATVLIGPLYTVCADTESWHFMLSEDAIDVVTVIKRLQETRTDVIDALIGDILVLEGEALINFSLAYGNLKGIIAAARQMNPDS